MREGMLGMGLPVAIPISESKEAVNMVHLWKWGSRESKQSMCWSTTEHVLPLNWLPQLTWYWDRDEKVASGRASIFGTSSWLLVVMMQTQGAIFTLLHTQPQHSQFYIEVALRILNSDSWGSFSIIPGTQCLIHLRKKWGQWFKKNKYSWV